MQKPYDWTELDDDDYGYSDPITLRKIREMKEPVISPNSGHVYDLEDLSKWIKRTGRDPITNQPLKEEMLVSGRFVKTIDEEAERKRTQGLNDLENKFMSMFQTMKDNHTAEFQLVNKQINELKDKNNEHEDKNNDLKILVDDLRIESGKRQDENKQLKEQLDASMVREEHLIIEKGQLNQEIEQVREQSNIFEKSQIHLIWQTFGPKIAGKLEKGASTPEREELLKYYAFKVKTAKTVEELKQAVNNVTAFKTERISRPVFFGPCVGRSETTRVVEEFQQNVNNFKGWKSS